MSRIKRNAKVEERCLALHIGLPGAGIPAIQRHFFAGHAGLRYLPSASSSPPKLPAAVTRSNPARKAYDELFRKSGPAPDLPRCRRVLAAALRDVPQAKVVGISRPSLATGSEEKARIVANRVKSVFPRTRVLVVLQHPRQLVEAVFMQEFTRNVLGASSRRKMSLYLQQLERWSQPGGSLPGANPDVESRLARLLNYARVIGEWTAVFGAEQVGVFTYESLLADPREFYRRVCRFLELDQQEGIGEKARTEQPVWTRAQLSKAQDLARSPGRFLWYRLTSTLRKRSMLGFAPWDPAGIAPLLELGLPARHEEQIAGMTRAGNSWLDKQFKLDLASYSYPMLE